jgi:hypothetical protein
LHRNATDEVLQEARSFIEKLDKGSERN